MLAFAATPSGGICRRFCAPSSHRIFIPAPHASSGRVSYRRFISISKRRSLRLGVANAQKEACTLPVSQNLSRAAPSAKQISPPPPHSLQEHVQAFQQSLYDLPFYGSLLYRALTAFGIYYVVDEYGIQLIRTEGPSMIPTLRNEGEIVLVEKFSFGRSGLKDGDDAAERGRQARVRQLDWESSSLQDGDRNPRPPSPTWYETASTPSTTNFRTLVTQLTTGLCVGDVIILSRPGREGTVCKRIIGLPGDIIILPGEAKKRHLTKQDVRKKAERLIKNLLNSKRGKPSMWEVATDGQVPMTQRQVWRVPDGHVWIEGDNSVDSVDSREYGAVPAALIIGRVIFRVWPLRGSALIARGDKRLEYDRNIFNGSITFPAGYEGEALNLRNEKGDEEGV